MSDLGSELGSELEAEGVMPTHRSLPTEGCLLTGNPNLLGFPYLRQLSELQRVGAEQEDRASLLGSAQYVSLSGDSDDAGVSIYFG